MTTATVMWSENDAAVVAESLEDLRDILGQLDTSHAGRPILISIHVGTDREVVIGLGGTRSVVTLNLGRGDGSTDEWTSVGDADSIDSEEFFYLGEHHTEILGSQLIPTPLATEAALEFVRTGNRPETVRWKHNEF